jgi:hypothetical protein
MSTNFILPSAWSWPDDNGRDHMVTEGSVLKEGPGRTPTFNALCGQRVPIRELRLRQLFSHCDACFDQVGQLIAKAMDD